MGGEEKRLLRVTEVAQLLGISRSYAYEMVQRRQLPALRLGRAIRVPLGALERWLEERIEVEESA